MTSKGTSQFKELPQMDDDEFLEVYNEHDCSTSPEEGCDVCLEYWHRNNEEL